MTTIAMTTMIGAIVIIWGGLAVSVVSLVRRSRSRNSN
ncbi:MAG: methionine/alanine import family NSS transporter small subunit [Propionibacteriaceae bacterium]|nr:methionine/alanine import family NSS transporter small subunit [Propionibacteriaceae bacterium]